ncbi:MAG: hypothetical protein H6836_02025 [Planctomycetes bacterium]|nr:hypothetical protein [Planctomycetota bacterium]
MKDTLRSLAPVCALAVVTQAQRPIQDLPRTIDLLQTLRTFSDVFDYTLQVVGNAEVGRKPPRRPALTLVAVEVKLKQALQGLTALRLDDPSAGWKFTAAELLQAIGRGSRLRGDDERTERKVVRQIQGLAKELSQQADRLDQEVRRLQGIAAASRRSDRVLAGLQEKMKTLHEAPVLDAFFRDAFGLAWLDIEVTIRPLVTRIANKATRLASDAQRLRQARRTALGNLLHNGRQVLRAIEAAQARRRKAGLTLSVHYASSYPHGIAFWVEGRRYEFKRGSTMTIVLRQSPATLHVWEAPGGVGRYTPFTVRGGSRYDIVDRRGGLAVQQR